MKSFGLRPFVIRRTNALHPVNLRQRRAWYTDDEPAQDADDTPEPPPAQTDDDKPATFDREYVEELRAENAKWRKQTRDLEKRLGQVETDQKKRQESELEEQQKWKELADKRAQELEALQAQLQTAALNTIRLKVATKLGIPVELAGRLQGDTEEDIQKDAEQFAAFIKVKDSNGANPPDTPEAEPEPAPNQQQARGRTTTPVPGGRPAGKTDADRKGRYFGSNNKSPIFQPGTIIVNGEEIRKE